MEEIKTWLDSIENPTLSEIKTIILDSIQENNFNSKEFLKNIEDQLVEIENNLKNQFGSEL